MRNRDSCALRVLGAALALVLAAGTAWAQDQSRLTGSVVDTTGAAIPGARLMLSNVATGVEASTESNEAGVYIFPYVAPGSYSLQTEVDGFKTSNQTGIILETGTTSTVNVQMEIGELTEVITVEATTPQLESATSSVGQFIERETVFNMPVISRRSASLVRLLGNISFRSEDGGEQIPKFSMAGGRSQNQMWTLDGSVVQNMAIGTQQLGLNPPAESLQEFKAEVSNYSAEFGRAGGGFILMTTRGGTNDFHGAVYEFFRNNAMDARSFFARETAPLRYNIFGGSLHGPIKRNKSFFFFNYEGARRRDGVTYSSDDVPHIPEKQGDFSSRAGLTLKDPMGGVFPNNIIPTSRFDPLGARIIQLYPDPDPDKQTAGHLANAPANNYVNNASNGLDQNYYTAKWDHNVSDADRISVRFMHVKAPQVIPGVYPQDFADPRAGVRKNRHHNTTVNWIHNFSPTMINEFRFNWGDRLHINRSAARNSGKNGEFGIGGVNPESFARINVNGLTPLVPGNQERIQTPIRTIEINQNQTLIRGSHQVKYGFNWRYSRNIDDQNNRTGGQFVFGNRATGVGTAELLLGHVSSADINDADILDRRTDYFGLFVQDDWRATSKLTLNLGLRYEVDTPLWDRNNRLNGFDWNAINPVSGLPGVITFFGRDGLGKYSHDTYLGAVGPRFGFAYQVGEDTVIRGGYGINYYGAYRGAVPNAFSLGFSTQGNFNSPDGGFTRALSLVDGMPPTGLCRTRARVRLSGIRPAATRRAPVLPQGAPQRDGPAVELRHPAPASGQFHGRGDVHRQHGTPSRRRQQQLEPDSTRERARARQAVAAGAQISDFQQRQPEIRGLGQLGVPLGQPEDREALLRRLQHADELHMVEVPGRRGGRVGAVRIPGQPHAARRAAPLGQGVLRKRYPPSAGPEFRLRTAARPGPQVRHQQRRSQCPGRRLGHRPHQRDPHRLALCCGREQEHEQHVFLQPAPEHPRRPGTAFALARQRQGRNILRHVIVRSTGSRRLRKRSEFAVLRSGAGQRRLLDTQVV